jgi:DNA polymerase-3 subunit alpha
VEFYEKARRAGVMPILGMEAYLAPRRRDDRGAKCIGGDSSYHLLLLASNACGYRNLMKLASIGYREGFYYKPRIDKEILAELSEGLICTSTCLGAELPQILLHGDERQALRAAEDYVRIFGTERFFIEVQNHGLPEQHQTNPALLDIADRLGVRAIATNDVHYLMPEDAAAHDVLLCISTNTLVSEENRLKFQTNEFYFKSAEEMAALFPERPDVIRNTLEVAALCDLELDFGRRHAPVYRPPGGQTDSDYLRTLVDEGAGQRYGRITPEIRERLDYELEVIASKGFASYFLIVWDLVRYARSRGIPCGARGSGCSSVVGYCLGLSAPDPLRYGLYFERFMDPDRDEMPDIDVDICQEGRQEIIDYVRRRYGHVAQIITFGTLKARAAVKDVARVMGMDFEQANRLTQLIPAELKMTIDKALAADPDLAVLYRDDPKVHEVIDIARRIEGLARHPGIHAAGVVVADQPLEDFLPLYVPPANGGGAAGEQQLVTQFDGPTVEKIGLLKMDFLGLRTLTVLERARQLAERARDKHIDLEALDLTDQKVYECFVRGDTKGIFQFESDGMRDVVLKMRPDRIEDLIAANALYRPGPMVNIDAYISRKHGEKWTTPHPIMTEVLAETYGIMVYQEQVSRLVNRLGGLELKQAFRLAKAISKKKTETIEHMREPFLQGCAQKGLDRDVAGQIFEDILRFGGYAFNKAHSTGYALIAFQTAYMKTYFPVEFMAALLTFEMGDSSKVTEYIEACRAMGIAVRPPDVNVSGYDFTPASGPNAALHLRFGLGAIKGVGGKAVQAILQAREAGGPFESLFDFCERVDLQAVNRGAIEALIKSGAFDSTGAMRKALMMVLPDAIEAGQALQRDRSAGQMSLLDSLAPAAPVVRYPAIPADQQWSEAELLAHEKEVLGFYITKHPLAQFAKEVRQFATVSTKSLGGLPDGHKVTLGCMLTKVRMRSTKTGGRMAIVTLEDTAGSIEGILFSSDLERLRGQLNIDSIAFFKGEVDRRREQPALRVSDIIPLAEARQRLTSDVHIKLSSGRHEPGILGDLNSLFSRHAGGVPVILRIETSLSMLAAVRLQPGVGVVPSDRFCAEADQLLGKGCLEFH